MKAVAALGVLVLLLLASPVTSQVPDDKLIVPGQRLGKWTLDMKIDDLLRMNGERNAIPGVPPLSQLPPAAGLQPEVWIHRWLNVRMAAWTIGRESQEVVALATSSEEYKTDKGIGSGTTREAIESAYGNPTAVTRPGGDWNGIYDGPGVAFLVHNNATETIAVFRSGSAKRIFRY